MAVDQDLPEINLEDDTEFFLRWTVEKYHHDVDWESIRNDFERTAELVRRIANACVESNTLASTELKAICHAANGHLTKSKLQEYIRDSGLREDLKTTLVEAVPESFGVVGGPLMDIGVQTDEAEATLLEAFATLLDDSSNSEELLDAVEAIANAETRGIKAGRVTPILSLLWPEVFPINNGRTRTIMNQYFGFDVSSDLQNYPNEILMYTAVQERFGFRDHFRDLDWYCHWVQAESDIGEWFEANDISDRRVWQINAGESEKNDPDKLWPVWRDEGICSIGWDIGDLRGLTPSEIEDRAESWDSDDVADNLKWFSSEIQPGQIVIAKDGPDLLGIGVTQDGTHHYCGDFLKTTTGVDHPYVWPVEWVVILEDIDADTREWDLDLGLQPRKALQKTNAFEQIRLRLTQKDTGFISDLGKLEELVADPPTATLPNECQGSNEIKPVTDPAPYYWVNQSQKEIEGEYLRAPTDERFQYDLPKLEVGDIVFSYLDGEVVGYHEVVQPARVINISPEEATAYDSDEESVERYRVETEFTRFAEPLAFAEVFETLWEHRLDQYYPVNPGGINQQYLFNLSEAAGEYLLQEGAGYSKEYTSIDEAEEDIRERLETDSDDVVTDQLTDSIVTTAIQEWTTVGSSHRVDSSS